VGEAEAAGPPALAAPKIQINVYAPSVPNDRLWQGEILANLPQVRLALHSVATDIDSDVEVEIDPHPFAIVLSQDCDLEQDYKARQQGQSVLPNVLLCDVLHASALRAKVREIESLGGKDWKIIIQNKNERFQFLQTVSSQEDLAAQGLPALAVDFRLYFTLRTDEIYRRLTQGTARRCRLLSPYAEHVSDRFSHYLARIALPADHLPENG
jgi:hypothetical protein